MERLRLIGARKNQGNDIAPTDFADSLLNLPGGSDPNPDFESILGSMGTDFDPGRFYFRNTTTEDVKGEVLKLRGYRAIGPDGIYMNQLVRGLEVLAPLLADPFNTILNTGVYPDVWKR